MRKTQTKMSTVKAEALWATLVIVTAELINSATLLFEAAWQSQETSVARLAAFSVGASISSWGGLFLSAFPVITARVGLKVGAEDTAGVARECRMAVCFATTVGIVTTVVFMSSAAAIIKGLYNLEGQASQLALPYTLTHLVGNVPMHVLYCNLALIKGMQRVNAYALLTMLKSLYLLSANYLAVVILNGGCIGSGVAATSSNCLFMLVTILWIRRDGGFPQFLTTVKTRGAHSL